MLLYALNFVLTFFHRLLTSESGVVQPFLANESGFISSRRGLPVAWTVGVIVIASALLGAPETVRAQEAHNPHKIDIGGSCSDSGICTSRCINLYGIDDATCEMRRCYCLCPGYTGP